MLDLGETTPDVDNTDSDAESTLELDDALDLEGSQELELDSLELDNVDDIDTSLEQDDSDDSEISLELDDSDASEISLELDDSDASEISLELDDSDASEISLELDDSDAALDTAEVDSEEDDLDLFDNEVDFDDLDDDFPELDAVGTKLDLAKAYIDMGDMESASSILNEVIDEGDDEQKSQAQSLLEQTTS